MTSKVTEQVVVSVKALTEAGVKISQIANTFNVSTCTISNIKKSGYNYVAYKSLTNKQFGKWRRHSLRQKSKPSKSIKSYTNKPVNDPLAEIVEVARPNNGKMTTRRTIVERLNRIEFNLNDVNKQLINLNKKMSDVAPMIRETWTVMYRAQEIFKSFTKLFKKV